MGAALGERLAALYARVPLGMRLGLDPMRAACARAGHPERAFPVVHIAGTNGKGSTSAMVEAIARSAGLRTGLFTSPHLCRFAERIRVDGEPIDDGALDGALAEALEVGHDLSFFETATLAAFLELRRRAVDLAVIEVGIGGRLDATNVVPPQRCTAITGVALDHQDKLGATLDAIALEKAAIARAGVPMVLGPMPEGARAAAGEVATAAGARLIDAAALPDGIAIGMLGAHQRTNGAVAWAIAAELGFPEEVRRRGLASARWPGRLERVESHGHRYLLDGAHNPDGASALVRAARTEDIGAVVFGALEDKAWREMLAILAAIDAPRFYVMPKGRAAVTPERLREVAPGAAALSLDDALARAAAAVTGKQTILICGSLYLVGEARSKLLGLPLDPIVAL